MHFGRSLLVARQAIVVAAVLVVAGAGLIPLPVGARSSSLRETHRDGYAGPKSTQLRFVQNAGQFDPAARFQVQAGGATVWLAEDALWLTVLDGAAEARPLGDGDSSPLLSSPAVAGIHLKFSFVGANPHPRLEPFNRLDTRVSYFTGSDPARWHADVPVWGGVRYVGLYPGVDLELRGSDGMWTQSFVLEPGAKPDVLNAVRMRVEGMDGIALDGDRLRLSTPAGEIGWPLFHAEAAPSAPRVVGGDVLQPFTHAIARPPFRARPTAGNGGSADTGGLLFSSFLGGGGDDSGWAMARDGSGALYLSGLTVSADFPTTPGALQTAQQALDAFVAKINPAGTAVEYSTFLGGSGEEGGRAIAVDASGAAYVTGYTSSADFPTTPGALQNTHGGGDDMFVSKLDADGAGLLYSTYIGRLGEDTGRDITLGPDGAATVVGLTRSFDFPVTAGAYQPVYRGLTDGVVLRLDPAGSGLVYSTFFGGADYDEIRAVQPGAAGTLYVTGRTRSADFPVTAGAYQSNLGGDSDAFVTRLDATGAALVYSTLLGGAGYDYGRGIALDAAGAAYVTGLTLSFDFPATPGAIQTTYGTHQDAFVTKVDPTGGALVYSTYLGAGGGDAGRGIVLDGTGAAYVSGWTTSAGFPTTPGAYQRIKGGVGDAFVTKLEPSGSSLAYSTFYGGLGDDGAYGGILLEPGAIVVSGYTASPDLPITTGAFQPAYGGGADDVFVMKLTGGAQPARLDIMLPLILYGAQP